MAYTPHEPDAEEILVVFSFFVIVVMAVACALAAIGKRLIWS